MNSIRFPEKSDIGRFSGNPFRTSALLSFGILVLLGFFFLAAPVMPGGNHFESRPDLSVISPDECGETDGQDLSIRSGAASESVSSIRNSARDFSNILRSGASSLLFRLLPKTGGTPHARLARAETPRTGCPMLSRGAYAHRPPIRALPFHVQTVLKKSRPVRAGPHC